ncbi:MAG: hypothetical protein HYU54_10040 [Actinobacteria bacterium]|nr:hypothetical protein [Actinomycetota bacterium]
MTKKKRRRRRPAAPTRALEPEARSAMESRREERGPGFLGSILRGSSVASPFPGGLASLGRGLLVVGSSAAILGAGFLTVLAVWLVLMGLGMEGAPGRLVDLLAIPPIGTSYDVGNGASLYGLGPGVLVFLLASVVLRAVITAVLSGMIVEGLERGGVSLEGVRRGIWAFPIVLAVNMLGVAVMITGNFLLVFLGPGIGLLGSMALLVGGLYFLAFAPVAAIREGRGLQETLRRSARTGRLPGGRHLLLVTLYFVLALPVMGAVVPGGSRLTANPGLGVWVFVLAANVVHLVFMAAFAYRWMVVEAEIPEQPVRRRR